MSWHSGRELPLTESETLLIASHAFSRVLDDFLTPWGKKRLGVDRNSKIAAAIVEREGGFVNHPADRGGPTNWGITLKLFQEIRGPKATVEQLKALKSFEAQAIYIDHYMSRPGFTKIEHDALFELVVDTAVNNGRDRASRWLQRAVGALEDGRVGPKTIAAVNAASRPVPYYKLCALRIKAYGALISENHSQAVFAAGWCNRVAEFVARVI